MTDQLLLTASYRKLLRKVLRGWWNVLSFSAKWWDLLLKAKKWSWCLFFATLDSMNNKPTRPTSCWRRGEGISRRRKDHCLMGTCVKVISWNVRGLNCPVKRGDVKWVLHKFACDVAILQESKLEVVGRPVVVSLWGRRQVQCCFCHLWAIRETLSSFRTLRFWSLRILESGVFRCATNSNPCTTALFRVLLGFMVLMMKEWGVRFLRNWWYLFLFLRNWWYSFPRDTPSLTS